MSTVLADIAAKTQPSEVVITTNPGERTRLCQSNPHRFAVGFLGTAAGLGIISTLVDGTVGLGITLKLNEITWFDIRSQGSFAQIPWYDTTAVGAITIIVYELVFPNGE